MAILQLEIPQLVEQVSPAGSVIEVRGVFPKALLPMLVTELGMATEVSSAACYRRRSRRCW